MQPPNVQRTPPFLTKYTRWLQRVPPFTTLQYCLYNIWVKTEAIDLELPRLLEPWLTRWNPAPQVMALDRVSALSGPDK